MYYIKLEMSPVPSSSLTHTVVTKKASIFLQRWPLAGITENGLSHSGVCSAHHCHFCSYTRRDRSDLCTCKDRNTLFLFLFYRLLPLSGGFPLAEAEKKEKKTRRRERIEEFHRCVNGWWGLSDNQESNCYCQSQKHQYCWGCPWLSRKSDLHCFRGIISFHLSCLYAHSNKRSAPIFQIVVGNVVKMQNHLVSPSDVGINSKLLRMLDFDSGKRRQDSVGHLFGLWMSWWSGQRRALC